MIRAVIVDDEQISLKALGKKLKVFCPEVEVIKLFSDPQEAIEEIPALRPQVVFLDIEMPNIKGFGFLQHFNPIPFEVIFTTAYSEYAIDALRISALDFLLKPIDTKELTAAVARLQDKLKNKSGGNQKLEEQLQLLFQSMQAPVQLDKIALPVLNGLEFLDLGKIIKIEAKNVYSVFYLNNGKTLLVTRPLKDIEKILSHSHFFRVHKSFIVNLKYIDRYIKGEGGTIILTDGSEVEVSRRNKTDFLNRINLK